MYITALEIENYKTFQTNQSIIWERGFNLLLGPNNAGKTSILDALELNWQASQPHKSIRSVRIYKGIPPGQSQFRCCIQSTFGELSQSSLDNIYLPITSGLSEGQASARLAVALKENSPLTLDFVYGGGTLICTFSDPTGFIEGRSQYGVPQSLRAVRFKVRGLSMPDLEVRQADLNNTLPTLLEDFKSRIYKFSAQRRPLSRGASRQDPKLDSEASSLPYCLNYLQTNDSDGHRQLCEWVNRIFPSIKWVQSTSLHNEFEIRCLPELPSAKRDDLAISMASMGTGIGNVLAMLYVVQTARTPQLIAIDEPNAFLHPKALRELLAILEVEGKQHQFLLTAHSADVLTAVTAKTISILNFDDVATTVEGVTLRDIHKMRSGLADLGLRVTDLHAKDLVFWVEGQTEELVMPEILRWACPEIAAGTAVLRVERTGTFSKKNVEASEVAALYERLSTSSALVPPMVTILLDGELLKTKHKEKVEKDSHGKLRYLPMRMLENYLLDAGAVKNALEEHGVRSSLENVSEQLTAAGLNDDSDLRLVDGAGILERVFSTLSEAKVEFRKTRDVPSLVTHLIENRPEHLEPLRRFLRDLFSLK